MYASIYVLRVDFGRDSIWDSVKLKLIKII